ncbi:MAG TPA: SAM-dependent methyltransferase [Streptosporangiaceae bacterium]|nr:SAM-dependent methyltransferase [Streptosporangiaceae bacterium]
MAGEPGWVPPGVDTRRANTARVYDYWLGGSHNFLADQDVGRAIAAVEPNMRAIARANRAFLGRAVRFLAAAGIRQFLDIGSGIPTQGNVHEVAQQADPAARVVYADIDPVAIAHSKAILAGNENATIIDADLRRPAEILANRETGRLIDFSQPVGLLLMVVLHFIAGTEDPWRVVATLRDALTPGSYLVLGHATYEGKPAVAQATEKVYNRSVATQLHLRSRAEILRFFDGFDLAGPGLVHVPLWRPDSPADVPSDPSPFGCLVGVGRKPDLPTG